MISAQPAQYRPCPGCGVNCELTDRQCWLCLIQFPPLREPAESAYRRLPMQFSLTSALLVTTLLAILLAACRRNPCLGTSLFLLATPALIRTIYAGRIEAARGHRLSTYEKILAFLASLAVMILSFAVGWVVLIIGCAVTFTLADATGPISAAVPAVGVITSILGLILSAGIALSAAAWVLFAMRPRHQ